MEKSLRVAIVDDLTEDSQRLADYLEQFQREHNMEIKMDVYNASFEFLEKYHGNYDVIFLDIEMPGSDGLEVAREIRTKDEAVGIIFVTGMAKYAVEGYAVHAIDFIVKPVGYYKGSTSFQQIFDAGLYQKFCFRVDTGGRFIQYQNAGIRYHGPGKCKQLFLADGQAAASFA